VNVIFIYPKIGSGTTPWAPLGILYIIAYMRVHNPDIHCLLVDSNFKDVDEACLRNLLDMHDPICVAIGAMTVQSADAIRIGALVHAIDPAMPVVWGGVHFTFMPQHVPEGNNYILPGEGEAQFSDLVASLIPHSGSISSCSDEFIDDLDTIPFPAYNMIDMRKYSDALVTGARAISIMTGRGCPYDCAFCASPQLWRRKVRLHSIPYLEKYIDYLGCVYNLGNLRIMDDTFCLSKERVMEFCNMVLMNGWHINMTCLTHVKTADREMFNMMRRAGFSIVAFGVESGSPEILKNINKNITAEEVESAVRMAKEAGLKTECLFMIGNIGETPATIQQSIDLKHRLKSDWAYFQYATPFPGSRFFTECTKHGALVTMDYSQYNHQNPVFIPEGMTADELVEWRRRAMS